MNKLTLTIVAALASTAASQAAYLVNGLPNGLLLSNNLPNTGASTNMVGSVINVKASSGGFLLNSIALFDAVPGGGEASNFGSTHLAGVWKRATATDWDLVKTVTFTPSTSYATSMVVPGLQYAVQSFSPILIDGVGSDGTDYFIGFTNFKTGTNVDRFLYDNAGGVSGISWSGGTGTPPFTATMAGYTFEAAGFSTATGLSSPITVSTSGSSQFGYNVLINLVPAPEVGSILMGSVLGLMGLGYRRRTSV